MADKKQTFTTPVGTLKYPYFNGQGRDYKGDKRFFYQTKFVLAPGADADAFEATLTEIEKHALANAKDRDGKALFARGARLSFPLCKRDEENNLEVSFKVPASFTSKKDGKTYSNKPRVFDSRGKAIADVDALNLGTGTMAQISFTVYAWKNPAGLGGVRLEPRAVMIAKPVEYTGPAQDAKDFGFSEFEGGWEYEEPEVESPATASVGEL